MKTKLLPLIVIVTLAGGCSRMEPANVLPPPATAQPASVATSSSPEPTAWTREQFLEKREKDSDTGLVVLDVRTPEEYAAGHVPRAINISHDALASRLPELEDAKDLPVVVYCRSGRRSALALDVLRDAGFTNLIHLQGDMLGWQEAGLPTEKTSIQK